MPYDKRVIDIVDKYQLIPHPEGGYYREAYKSSFVVTNAEGLTRPASTAIYFLLTAGNFSAFHRIKSDELWHHYDGDALVIHTVSPAGVYAPLYLGHDRDKSHRFQAVVPAGHWFASEVNPGGSFSLVGCTVAPGFDFADFELAKADQLSAQFPGHDELIRRLSRG